VLARLSEPQRYPALSVLRDRFLSWRFYHSSRTDPESPLRRPLAVPRESQVWVTTHARELAEGIGHLARVKPVQLVKDAGATRVAGQRLVEPEADDAPEAT
jgi:predicted ATPase